MSKSPNCVLSSPKKLFTTAALLNQCSCNLQNYVNSPSIKNESGYTIDDWKEDSFKLELYLSDYTKNKNISGTFDGEIVLLADEGSYDIERIKQNTGKSEK